MLTINQQALHRVAKLAPQTQEELQALLWQQRVLELPAHTHIHYHLDHLPDPEVFFDTNIICAAIVRQYGEYAAFVGDHAADLHIVIASGAEANAELYEFVEANPHRYREHNLPTYQKLHIQSVYEDEILVAVKVNHTEPSYSDRNYTNEIIADITHGAIRSSTSAITFWHRANPVHVHTDNTAYLFVVNRRAASSEA